MVYSQKIALKVMGVETLSITQMDRQNQTEAVIPKTEVLVPLTAPLRSRVEEPVPKMEAQVPRAESLAPRTESPALSTVGPALLTKVKMVQLPIKVAIRPANQNNLTPKMVVVGPIKSVLDSRI